MKESVNEFILYNKFVTGPSSTQQRFFMETRNALRAAFISSESNDNLTRTIAALPECISSEGMLIFIWPVIRQVSVFFEERHTVHVVLLHDVIDACHTHKSQIFLDQFHGYPHLLKTKNKTLPRHWYLNVDYLHATLFSMMSRPTPITEIAEL